LKILVVYNCCGILNDNLPMWSAHLNKILRQTYEDFHLCISACQVSKESRNYFVELQGKHLPNKIFINFIKDTLPVNITFNKSCMEASKIMNFDAFLYLASDVNFTKDTKKSIKDIKKLGKSGKLEKSAKEQAEAGADIFNVDTEVISKLVALHKGSNAGITSGVVNNDHGIIIWLGEKVFDLLDSSHYEIPIGKTINLHCMLFDRKIYDNYNNRIIPDIFRSYCTESVFSYLTASLGLKFMIHDRTLFLTHYHGKDKGCAGFPGYKGWKDLFRSKLHVKDRLMTNEAISCGFGYEEELDPPVFPHDPNYYHGTTHISPQTLLDFNRKALYLGKDEFDYDTINSIFRN